MVAAVLNDGHDHGGGVPDPVGEEMGAHEHGAHGEGQQVGQDELDRVAVDGYDTDGRRPLVVHFVDGFVQRTPVQQSEDWTIKKTCTQLSTTTIFTQQSCFVYFFTF